MAVEWRKLAFDDEVQPLDAGLTALAALADAAGVLTNNGAGALSWGAGGGGGLPLDLGDKLIFNADDGSDTYLEADAGTKALKAYSNAAHIFSLFAAGLYSHLPIRIQERAAAGADSALYGQLWVKNTNPNQLWYTDGEGNEFEIFKPACFNAYRTDTFVMTTANVWHDIPFNIAATLKKGFTHDHTTDPEEITVTKAGIYRIAYRLQFLDGQPNLNFRLLLDGTEIPGSSGNHTAYFRAHFSDSILVAMGAGGVIKVQGTSAQGNVDIVWYANGAAPTTRVAAAINIERLE